MKLRIPKWIKWELVLSSYMVQSSERWTGRIERISLFNLGQLTYVRGSSERILAAVRSQRVSKSKRSRMIHWLLNYNHEQKRGMKADRSCFLYSEWKELMAHYSLYKKAGASKVRRSLSLFFLPVKRPDQTMNSWLEPWRTHSVQCREALSSQGSSWKISAANERECSWRMNTHKSGAFQCIDSLFEKGTFRPDGNLRNLLTEPSNRSLPCVIRCEVNHYLSFLLPMGKGTCSFLDWPSRPEKTQGWESIQAATWVRQNHRSTRKWVRPWMRSNKNF